MKRPSTPSSSLRSRLRPLLFPLLAVVILLAVFNGNQFDPDAVAKDLAQGRVEAALARLASAEPDDLLPALTGVHWWPQANRAAALVQLADQPIEDFLEDPSLPTLIAPLDRYRTPPTAIELREGNPETLSLEVVHFELNLVATTKEIPPHNTTLPLEIRLLPGAGYTMALRNPDGIYIAMAKFDLLTGAETAKVEEAMTATGHLSREPHGQKLLSAIVALHFGLTAEALGLFEELESVPAFSKAARDLRILTLREQGLDHSALGLLQTSR